MRSLCIGIRFPFARLLGRFRPTHSYAESMMVLRLSCAPDTSVLVNNVDKTPHRYVIANPSQVYRLPRAYSQFWSTIGHVLHDGLNLSALVSFTCVRRVLVEVKESISPF